ncbi:MAG: gamma-glutamyl-phosphate reductase, partial [Bacteroidales bacterium]|nr:gamma-glutamyl-phosphate reductase [Bacteroidales bacterium]
MDIFEKAKRASVEIALLDNEIKSKVLTDLAARLEASSQIMLEANAKDLAKMEASNPLYDRLKLDIKRLKGIADDMRHVATLPSPVGQIIEDRTLVNGLRLRKVSVPFGVIGVVYEARPNVTFDVFSLCFKSGNACMLKGGKDAD